MYIKYTYTLEQLIEAIKNSLSIRQVLIKLNLSPAGGSYKSINKAIKNNNIDTSHFTGQLWSKGKTIGPKRPIQDYLDNKFSISSHSLKNRLLKEGMFSNICNDCKLSEWKDLPIPLELHHIDGNHSNNNFSNLSLLCPNCHSFTSTYRGKKLSKTGRKMIKRPKTLCLDCKKEIRYTSIRCKDCSYKVPRENNNRIKLIRKKTCKCGKEIDYRSYNCRSCRPRKSNIDWPPTQELIERLKSIPYTTLAKELGVSDNAIRRRLKDHPI